MNTVNLTEVKTAALVAIYNTVSEAQVARFADRKSAIRRTEAALAAAEMFVCSDAEGLVSAQEVDGLFVGKAAPVAPVAEEAKAPAAPRKGKPSTRATYGEEETIAINVAASTNEETGQIVYTNPKRPGSKAHARLQILIERGEMTVGDYLDACHELEGKVKPRHKYRVDISWDIEHGFITFPDGAK